MTEVFASIEAATRACAEALDALSLRTPLLAGRPETTWDVEAAVHGLERVEAAFVALGEPTALQARVPVAQHPELEDALRGLARVHALLTVSVAREKDTLRDRLNLANAAARGFGWHASEAAGARCDIHG